MLSELRLLCVAIAAMHLKRLIRASDVVAHHSLLHVHESPLQLQDDPQLQPEQQVHPQEHFEPILRIILDSAIM
jgi:hypothetical protein